MSFHFFAGDKGIEEFYLFASIRSFALSMINLFAPIYLLKLGYSLSDVLLFYLIVNLAHALTTFPSIAFGTRFGFVHLLFLNLPFTILFYAFLHTLNLCKWPLWVVALVSGVANCTFYVAYHFIFSELSKKEERGKEISVVNVVSSLVSTCGPLIGGLVLSFSSFQLLFGLVSLLLCFSVLPITFAERKMRFEKRQRSRSPSFKRALKRSLLLPLACYGVEGVVNLVIWPVFVFLVVVKDFTALGALATACTLLSWLFTLFIGRLTDLKRVLLLRAGAVLTSFAWLVKSAVRSAFQVFFVDSFYKASRTMLMIPFNAVYYDWCEKDVLTLLATREIVIQLGRVVFLSFLLLRPNVILAFFSGALASLGVLFFAS